MAYKNIQDKRNYQNAWAKKNADKHHAFVANTRAKFVTKMDALKMHPCLDCGFVPEFAVQMDWDHITDNKSIDVAKLRNLGNWSKVLEEIEKCELVCANCHRKRTHLRRTAHQVVGEVS